MNTFSNECVFNELDSFKNRDSDHSSYNLNDFNLNDFYKCIKLNKLKKSLSENSLLNDNSTDNGVCDRSDHSDENSKTVLSFKRSRLLSRIGSFKAKYPEKMGIVEYLLHSYVILNSPNPVTIYSYESVFKNMSPDSEEFWKTLRTLTSVHLDVDKFPNNVGSYISILLDPENKTSEEESTAEDAKKLDLHFTWLCKCCIDVTDARSDYDDDETSPKESSYKRRLLNNQLMLSNIFSKNYDLSAEVLYEALRQRGNRFVQRSLYNNIKNLAGLTSRGIHPNVVAKLGESNSRMKRFVDIIQQSSLDSSDPSSYNNYYDLFGDERRHSSRRSMLLRRKYC